jgi:hypothetical protein
MYKLPMFYASVLIAAGGGHIMNDADSLDAMIWGVVGRGPEED